MFYQANYCKDRVNRQCVENIKASQNPIMLVGLIIEMVMALIGQRTSQLSNKRRDGAYLGSREEQSGRQTSASSCSTKFTGGGVKKC